MTHGGDPVFTVMPAPRDPEPSDRPTNPEPSAPEVVE